MNVPFVDLKPFFLSHKDEILGNIAGICDASSYILGPQVSTFEAAFADYCGVKHAIGVANGTDALELALRSLGIGAGDEVIVPAMTYFATGLAVSLAGACPVFVDIGPDYLIDVDQIDSAITSRTRAIIPVHLYGQPADMDAILAVASRRGLAVIEDCAQSHGARFKGKMTGTFGAIGCFSFYPSKNLGAFGDAGAIVTNDSALAERLRTLRNVGAAADSKYRHIYEGRNSRLDSIQAAVLSFKLPFLSQGNDMRKNVASRYVGHLSDYPVGLPMVHDDRSHVYHLFVIEVAHRDRIQDALQQAGVQVGIHYPCPMHLHPAFERLRGKKGQFPIAEKASEHVLSLPMFPELSTEQVDYVTTNLIKHLQ